MKLIFVSNYFNHHQLPFCDALYELLEGDFCFLQTQPMEEERVKMGWQAEALCIIGVVAAYLLYFVMLLRGMYDVEIRLLPYLNWIFN